jgi:hypothetical protein
MVEILGLRSVEAFETVRKFGMIVLNILKFKEDLNLQAGNIEGQKLVEVIVKILWGQIRLFEVMLVLNFRVSKKLELDFVMLPISFIDSPISFTDNLQIKADEAVIKVKIVEKEMRALTKALQFLNEPFKPSMSH